MTDLKPYEVEAAVVHVLGLHGDTTWRYRVVACIFAHSASDAREMLAAMRHSRHSVWRLPCAPAWRVKPWRRKPSVDWDPNILWKKK